MKKIFIYLFLTMLFLFPLINVSAQTSAPEPVNYTLPYPGILPDNPLYFLKAIRDQLVSLSISDPLKKAKFDLLQADKKLASGVSLFKEGESKYSLMVTTISKGENYFDDALSKLYLVQKRGDEVKSFASTISTAARKHVEVLKDLESKTNGQTRDGLKREEKRVETFEKTADKFIQ